MKAATLFTLPPSLELFSGWFLPDLQPWEWVKNIAEALSSEEFMALALKQQEVRNSHNPSPELAPPIPPGVTLEGLVWIHPSVHLPPTATICGPAWIGPQTHIRPGAFIRGNVIIGAQCVIGNSCEYKNCLLMDRVETPHYNYVGDSVLGSCSHLGAGVILANLRQDRGPVPVKLEDGTRVSSGLRKLGSILGEGAEAGCNCVLQPGTILGRGSMVMPLTSFSGFLPAGHRASQPNRFVIHDPVHP